VERRIFEGVRLTILGRRCALDVMELEDGIPALVGYVPLEILDFQPDVQKGTLVPSRGTWDKPVADLYQTVCLRFAGP